MRESRDNYILRRMKEDESKNNGYIEYGYRGLEELEQLKQKNQILSENVYDLQEQLQNSYIKQKSFLDKLHELQQRKTIALAMEMKQLNFDFKPSDKK